MKAYYGKEDFTGDIDDFNDMMCDEYGGMIYPKVTPLLSQEEFISEAIENGVQNDSTLVFVTVRGNQYAVGVTEVLDHDEVEPFEASDFMENHPDADAWEILYGTYENTWLTC